MKYKHFKQALLFKVDSLIIFFSVAMELNQSILYTPLILVDENGNPIHQKTSPASVLDEKKEEGEDVTLDNL